MELKYIMLVKVVKISLTIFYDFINDIIFIKKAVLRSGKLGSIKNTGQRNIR